VLVPVFKLAASVGLRRGELPAGQARDEGRSLSDKPVRVALNAGTRRAQMRGSGRLGYPRFTGLMRRCHVPQTGT
jgi:hypothetical protein